MLLTGWEPIFDQTSEERISARAEQVFAVVPRIRRAVHAGASPRRNQHCAREWLCERRGRRNGWKRVQYMGSKLQSEVSARRVTADDDVRRWYALVQQMCKRGIGLPQLGRERGIRDQS